MATIYFYHTGYNPNNRPYSRSVVDSITSVFGLQFDESYIYPEPLYISAYNGYKLLDNCCDYVIYVYNGKKHYAFIKNVVPNPLSDGSYQSPGGFTVYLEEDIWTTYVLTEDGLNSNVRLDGRLLRAHVNDWEDGKATLKYTTDEPEEEILYDGMVFDKVAYVDGNQGTNFNSRYKILYVLCTVPKNDNVQIIYYNNVVSKLVDSEAYALINNQYYLYFAPIDTALGSILNIYCKDTGGTGYYSLTGAGTINDLTVVAGQDSGVASYGIVNMFISDIIPEGFYFKNNALYRDIGDLSSSDYASNELYYSDRTTLLAMPILTLSCSLKMLIPANKLLNKSSTITSSIISSATYSTYVSDYIVKVNSSIYNPRALSFGDSSIKLDFFYEIPSYYSSAYSTFNISVYLDPLLQYIGIYRPNSYIQKRYSAFTICQIYSQIEPTIHNSYWTRLDARQSTIEANREKTTATVKYAQNIVSGVASTVGSVFTGNVGGAVSGVVNTAFGAVTGLYDLSTIYERSNIAIQKNESIINGGLVQTVAYGGSQRFMLNDTIFYIWGDLTDYNKTKIALQLHKYGYLTNIAFNKDYFATHERQSFNFILAENTICSGLPSMYCRDIADMFNKGVTLWKSTPLDYEVVNFPVNAV